MWILYCALAAAGEADEVEARPDASLALVPFGVAQFAWGAPGAGVAYAGTQLAGLGLAIGAGVAMDEAQAAAAPDAEVELLQGLMAAGVGLAAVSYAIELIDGSRMAEARARLAVEAQARRSAVQGFDAALVAARGEAR